MASISHDKTTGRRLIQLSPGEHAGRPKIRLGKVTKREAESARVHIENLLRSRTTGSPMPPATADWLAAVPESLRRRIERAGLVAPPGGHRRPTLAEWVPAYIEGRSDVKPGTKVNMEQVERNLLAYFGPMKRLDEVTAGDAEDFRIHLKSEGLSEGTVRRRCKRARQFFSAAIKKKLIAENPFADMKCGNYANAARFYFVSREEAAAVLDACPDAERRLIFALCRYGGLRCPSEILRLRWGDVDWERKRFTVHASKTEHHADGGIRQVPIFPELHPYLRDSFEQAEPRTEHVVTRCREATVNLRTQLNRIIKRAGLTPWPKLFQNLRSTRETELAEDYPMQVVCAWIGNSQPVAAKHYLQVTEDHYKKAVHDPVQSVHERACQGLPANHGDFGKETLVKPRQNDATHCKSKRLHRLTPRRLELRLPG